MAVFPQINADRTSLCLLAISVSFSNCTLEKKMWWERRGGVGTYPFQDEPGSEAGQSTELKTLTESCRSRISTSTTSVPHHFRPLFSGKAPSSTTNALPHCITKHPTKLHSKETLKHNQSKSKDISSSELLSPSTGSLATAEAKCSFPTRPFIHCSLGHYGCQWALNLTNSNLIALIVCF